MNVIRKTAALIVAAGRGQRARTHTDHIAKQYHDLGGESVLARTVRRFSRHKAIDAILVVIHGDDRALYDGLIKSGGELADESGNAKLLPPVHGGKTRQGSVLAGLQALQTALGGSAPDLVLIHDAVRPFIPASMIDAAISALEKDSCVLPALAVTDTLKQGEAGYLSGSADRANLWRAQTPQGFHFAEILKAHRAGADAGRSDFTDDSSIAAWHGLKVRLIEGSPLNIKLTTPEDFQIAEALVMQEQRQDGMAEQPPGRVCVATGFDVHAFEPGNQVTLCGVSIPHSHALKGHSDADVGLHALTDAILGALGEGDIGTHFPPSDPQWAGADSALFLQDAARRVAERNGTIDHADVTLICQAPKIGPHRDAMRARIATILDIPATRVSVKATTTEGLGFTGRKEGIAAMATATLHLP